LTGTFIITKIHYKRVSNTKKLHKKQSTYQPIWQEIHHS